jgi:uncharacterized protein YciI
MEFEQYTLAFLVTNPDEPERGEAEAARLQDAHLSHLADLYDAGHLLAVGPLSDPEGELRGLSIFRGGVEATRALVEEDPAVVAGRFLVRLLPWSLPAGLVTFTPGRLPRSVADVRE